MYFLIHFISILLGTNVATRMQIKLWGTLLCNEPNILHPSCSPTQHTAAVCIPLQHKIFFRSHNIQCFTGSPLEGIMGLHCGSTLTNITCLWTCMCLTAAKKWLNTKHFLTGMRYIAHFQVESIHMLFMNLFVTLRCLYKINASPANWPESLGSLAQS